MAAQVMTDAERAALAAAARRVLALGANPIGRSPFVIAARGVVALGEVYAGADLDDWNALVDQLELVGLRVIVGGDP